MAYLKREIPHFNQEGFHCVEEMCIEFTMKKTSPDRLPERMLNAFYPLISNTLCDRIKSSRIAQKPCILQRLYDQKQNILLAKFNIIYQLHFIQLPLNQTEFLISVTLQHTCILISKIHVVVFNSCIEKTDYICSLETQISYISLKHSITYSQETIKS